MTSIVKRWKKRWQHSNGIHYDVIERADKKLAWVPTGTDEPIKSEDGWFLLDGFEEWNHIHNIIKEPPDVEFAKVTSDFTDATFETVEEKVEEDTDPHIDMSWVKQSNGLCYFCGLRRCKHV